MTAILPWKSLYCKLALTLGLLLLLIGSIYALLSAHMLERSFLSSHQQLNRSLAVDLAQEMGLVSNQRVNRSAMADAFRMIMLVNPSVEIYYLDMQGRIIDFSADADKIKLHRVDLEPVQRFLAEDSMYPLQGDDPKNPGLQKPFSVAMLPDTDQPQGYLYVVLQSARFDQFQLDEQSRAMHQYGLWTLAISLGIALIVGLFFFHRLTRRIRRLGSAMDGLRESNFELSAERLLALRANHHSDDEIAQLSRSFESMVEHISQQYQSLEKQDRLRRELVVNVSHDLRTPLAALHGYLERLQQKFGLLSEQESLEYIEISLRHSASLNKLIDDLFELSKLDAQEIRPILEPFLLSELAQDAMQKFHWQAKARGIELNFDYDTDLPLVNGDIALLDRVICNLLENALEHTHSGGKVSLAVEHSGNQVVVKVKDNGKGIAEEHLDSIFKRFYQASQSASGRDHAGLGLAIAQRIIELHGQAIQVTSKLSEGTVFRFAIPVWQSD